MASRSTPSTRSTQPVAMLVPQGAHLGKPSMPLNRPLTLVGSRHRAHLHLLSRTISKTHAVLINTSEGIYIRDLASRTHVLINGEPVKEALLNGGDLVKLGSFTFRYTAAPGRRVIGKSPPDGALEIQGSPIPMPIEARTVLIGRRPTCDIPLTEMSVSICHALIFQIDGIRYVRDLGSRTGTFVNGETVHQHALEVGDTLRIGDTEIRYVDEESAEAQLDELEDLVGTASLTDDAPALMGPPEDAIEPYEAHAPEAPALPDEIQVTSSPLPEPAEALDVAEPHEAETEPPETEASTAPEPADDDLIPIFDVVTPAAVAVAPALPAPPPEPAVSSTAQAEPPVPDEPEWDDLELAPIDDVKAEQPSGWVPSTPPAEPADDLVEIDLANDPDISGSDDTARVPMDAVLGHNGFRPAPPVISDLVVEEEPTPATPAAEEPMGIDREEHPRDTIDLRVEEDSQMLVDANLHEQRLSSSGTFAGLDLDLAEEAEAHAGNVQVDVRDFSLDEPEPSESHVIKPMPTRPTSEAMAAPREDVVHPQPEAEEFDLAPISVAPPTSQDTAIDSPIGAPAVTASEVAPVTDAALDLTPPMSEVVGATASSVDDLTGEGAFADLDLSSLDLSESEVGPATPPALAEAPAAPAAITPVEPTPSEPEAAPEVEAEAQPATFRFGWRGRRGKRKSKVEIPTKPLRIPPADSDAGALPGATAQSEQVSGATEEILAPTGPTPESAQGLASEIVGSGLGGLITESEATMTDSTFGRAVQEFSGSQLEPLEESPVAEPPASTTSEAEASAVVDDSAPFEPSIGEMPTDLGMLDDAPMTESGLTDLSFEIAEQVLAADAAFATPTDFDEELAHDLGLISEDPFAASMVENLEAPLELDPIAAAPDAASFTDPAEELATLLGEPSQPIDFSPVAPLHDADIAAATGPLLAEPLGASVDEREIDLSNYPSAVDPADPDPAESRSFAQAQTHATPNVIDLSLIGMTRDQASFIGGMPINWESTPAASAEPERAAAAPTDPHTDTSASDLDSDDFVPDALISEALNDPAEATLNFTNDSGEETLASFLARLETTEPTPELFESTPGKLDALPDSMFPIQDVVEVLGEHAGPRIAEEPPEFSSPPAPTPRNASDRARDPSAPLTPPRVVPPPPPRPRGAARGRGNAAPVANNPFGAGSESPIAVAPSEITIPPYTGSKPASMGHITTAFDGLAMAPVRETDVFSQLANPAAAGALSGLSADVDASAAAPRHGLTGIDFRPGESSGRRGRPGGFGGGGVPPIIPESRITIPDYAPLPRPGTTAPSPRFPSRQSKAKAETLKPRRRPIRLGVLLPIVIVLAAASLGAIYFLIHAQATAQLFLRFDGLDKVSQQERLDLERKQRENLAAADTLQFAKQVYVSATGGKGNPGFLGTPTAQEHAAYAAMVDSASIPAGGNKLVMQMASVDPPADRLRLFALLQALYSQNQKMGDDASRARDAYAQAIKASDDAKEKIARLTDQVKTESDSIAKLGATLARVSSLKDENAAKWKAWTDAAAQLRDAQAEVDRLDVKPVAVGDNTPSNGAVTKADDDAQIKELSARLTTLNNNLSAARTTHTASTDAANRALDAALGGFQSRIAEARSSLKDGSELSGYLAAAQQAQDTIRQLNADLIDRQKSEQQRLNELRRVLGEKQEARLKAAWESDPQLSQMQQDLSVAEHRYNVASGSGLGTDAKTLSTQIETLKKQIDARRDLIGTGDIYAEEVKGLQQFIDDSLKSMDRERARNDQRLADALKTLNDAAPRIEKLPVDQQKMAEDFGRRLAEMKKAREEFDAAIAAPAADPNIQSLETQATELQAKLDTRRKQLSDENRKALSIQQETVRAAALEEAKKHLAAARDAETNASIAVRANKEQLDDVQIAADQGRAVQARLVADNTRLLELQASQKQQQQKADDLYAVVQQSVLPEKPTEENVTLPEINDPRKVYMLYTSLGYALLLVVLLLAMSRGMHHHPPVHGLASAGPATDPTAGGNGHAFEHTGTLEARGNGHEDAGEHADDEAQLTA